MPHPPLASLGPLSRRSALLGLTSSLALPVLGRADATSAGYDVVLLCGQSNMTGYNSGTPDNAADAAISPRVWQLDATSKIIPAVDPLIHAGPASGAGLGLTFGKAYAATLPANRSVLLVGAAYGATGFATGLWQAPSGFLATNAVARANAAMAAAGPGARFAGILWHQGENDIAAGISSSYGADLTALIAFLRGSITGAGDATPFVCGEMTYTWIADNINGNHAYAAQQLPILQVFHGLPDEVPHTAWVSSFGLLPDPNPAFGDIHFGALAHRQFGRRYADKFFEATQNLPQPDISMKSWSGFFVNDGRGLLGTDGWPVNPTGAVGGVVTAVADPVHGTVAQTTGGGWITYSVSGTLFNFSYTKMAWFKVGRPGFYNNLVSASNPGQAHWLAAVTAPGQVTIAAGHNNGAVASIPAATATVPAATGVWLHVAVVYDGPASAMTLYCNGVAVAAVRNLPQAPRVTGVVPLVMGAFGTQGAGVDGQMGGNRAWSSALTPAQIAAIYTYENRGRAGF